MKTTDRLLVGLIANAKRRESANSSPPVGPLVTGAGETNPPLPLPRLCWRKRSSASAADVGVVFIFLLGTGLLGFSFSTGEMCCELLTASTSTLAEQKETNPPLPLPRLC